MSIVSYVPVVVVFSPLSTSIIHSHTPPVHDCARVLGWGGVVGCSRLISNPCLSHSCAFPAFPFFFSLRPAHANDVAVMVVFRVPLPLLAPSAASWIVCAAAAAQRCHLALADTDADIRGGPFTPLPTLGFKQLLWDRPSGGPLLTQPRYEAG